MQQSNISKNAFEQCVKCNVCTLYCPMVAVRKEYPGPKGCGPDTERYRLKAADYFDETLKYCLNCKRCEVACPSGVHPADIIASARLKYSKAPVKLRDRILANTDFMGTLASPFSFMVNPIVALKPTKAIMDGVLGIDHRRTFPKYSGEKFESWFKKYQQEGQFTKTINYFHGCFVQYNFPSLGKDFVKVCNALGIKVELLKDEKCCGVALMANGLGKKAKKNATHNIKAIEASGNSKTVATSSSCTFMIKDEYGSVLGVNHNNDIDLASRFIYHEMVNGGLAKLKFKKDFALKLAYHTPCHLERLGWGVYSQSLLRLIPGVDLTVLDSNCCGISGTYGFKKENYEYSQAIGAPLFAQIEEVNPDYVACDCETCRWQIEMSTPKKVLHPITVLAMALED